MTKKVNNKHISDRKHNDNKKTEDGAHKSDRKPVIKNEDKE